MDEQKSNTDSLAIQNRKESELGFFKFCVPVKVKIIIVTSYNIALHIILFLALLQYSVLSVITVYYQFKNLQKIKNGYILNCPHKF